DNAKIMAQSFMELDYELVSNGTDTHVVLIDLTNKNISGKLAEKVLEKAKEKIANMERNSEYSSLITKLLTEATSALNTSDVIVYTNSKDKDVVQSAVSNISGAELSNDPIDCMGGVKVTSKDGSMSFDNTIDARIELLKPLIRKDIAAQFNLGN
ncbi:MAG: V-type ATP synthase subunit E family protein, partial [Candidatus Nitrosopelagicus sp.]|nr:V-type ATP synthase subunit E family protein [Candidatus Nitrosopelagicus sp.]